MEKINRILKKSQEKTKANVSKRKVVPWIGVINKDNLNKHFSLFQKLAGDDYIINDNNREIIKKLLVYFSGSLNAETEYNLSLNKGILLMGNHGVGKTILFKKIHKYLCVINSPNIFRNTSTEEIITELKLNNDRSSLLSFNLKYNNHGVETPHPLNICIHEFASFYDMKIWGNDVKILMESFYMTRYEIFQNHDKIMHATYNYDLKTIENSYPEKLVDRFREMFNMIELKGDSFRI